MSDAGVPGRSGREPDSPSDSALDPKTGAAPAGGNARVAGGDAGDAGRTGEPGAGLDPQSDQWLVAKARSGDPDAWEVLIRRHRDRMYRIALRMLDDPDDAEDVTQDVAVVVWTSIAGFAGASSFTTWLYRIVINRCLNQQKRRRPTRPIHETDHPSTAGPERTVLARGHAEAFGVALAALPTHLRSALVLHEMEELSYQEVATILNVSEPTVRGRIYRARRTLLTDLAEWS